MRNSISIKGKGHLASSCKMAFTRKELLGMVFGVLSMISSSMMPFGMLLFGPLSDYVKIEWMLIGTGILMIVETIFLLGNKALIEIGRS